MDATARHCDEYIDDPDAPECLRRWLSYHRLAAVLKRPDLHGRSAHEIEATRNWIDPDLRQYLWTDPEPALFADHDGKRVRCVMASRFGDVGVTQNLDADRGYTTRLPICRLSNFSTEPTHD